MEIGGEESEVAPVIFTSGRILGVAPTGGGGGNIILHLHDSMLSPSHVVE